MELYCLKSLKPEAFFFLIDLSANSLSKRSGDQACLLAHGMAEIFRTWLGMVEVKTMG